MGAAVAGASISIGSGEATAQPSSSRRHAELYAADLHIVTITDTSVTIAWMTYAKRHFPYFTAQDAVPADSEVRIGRADFPGARAQVHYDASPSGYHQMRIGGLAPGTTYRFEARSNGVRAVPNYFATKLIDPMTRDGFFTTLTRPPGDYVQTVAVLNDTHVGLGEHLVVGTDETPYSYFMLEDELAEIKAVDPSIVLVNGDLTSEARPHELKKAKEILDGYGREKVDYFLTRGNHDRPHRASEDPRAAYETGTLLPKELEASSGSSASEPFYDNVIDYFDLPYQQMWVTRRGNLRIVGLDSSMAENSAGGTIRPSQIEAFRAEMESDPSVPTIVMSHHPLSFEQAATAWGSRPFLMDKRSATQVEHIEAAAPGTFLHLGGHTHRGRRSRGHIATNVEFLETPASGEFPNVYTLIDLYTGGYMVTSHRPNTARVRGRMVPERWSSHGVLPEGTLYRTDNRNFTVVRDLSGLI